MNLASNTQGLKFGITVTSLAVMQICLWSLQAKMLNFRSISWLHLLEPWQLDLYYVRDLLLDLFLKEVINASQLTQ